jgi:hypothetical protein
MNWLNRLNPRAWLHHEHPDEEVRRDKLQLLQEIRKAHLEWITAQCRFDFVVEKDQIDYAIYALEAAEKRYEMLLKLAKQAHLSLIDSDRILEVKA